MGRGGGGGHGSFEHAVVFFYGRRRAVDGWGGWKWTLVEVEIRSEYRLCMLLCVE